MSSQAQINANKVNAQHSTGPVTAEGKSRSARNSLRHGLTSRDVVIPPGMEAEFETLQRSLRSELQPQGALQELVFRQLVHAAWNLERIRRMEAETDLSDPKFAILMRYYAQTERSFGRALKQMRELHALPLRQEPRFAGPGLVRRRQFTGQPLTPVRPRRQGNAEASVAQHGNGYAALPGPLVKVAEDNLLPGAK